MQGFFQYIIIVFAIMSIVSGCTKPKQEITRNNIDGRCYGKVIEPAEIETITSQIKTSPGVYETKTQLNITKQRQEIPFQAVCPEQLSIKFMESLQRALSARHFYKGPITGDMGHPTRRAILAYQTQNGLKSAVLATQTAQSFGLLPKE